VVWRSRRGAAVGAVLALAVIAGCAPSVAPAQTPTIPQTSAASPSTTPAPTPTATPTTTPTWGAAEAAAVRAVDDFDAASSKVAADPAAFTKNQMTRLFKQSVGGDVLTRNVDSFMKMRAKGYREVGTRTAVSTLATKPVNDGRGVEVHVTRCWDQRGLSVVDADGAPVGAKEGDEGYQYPDYNLRQYTVLKQAGESDFRVFGVETINGSCP